MFLLRYWPSALGIGLLLTWPMLARGDIYDQESRVQHIDRTIAALKSAGAENLIDLQNYIHTVDRNQCRSAHGDLQASCLVEAAQRNCDSRKGNPEAMEQCRLISDIIIVNKLGEKTFIDAETKYEIMRDHSDYRAALRKELLQRYAWLALAFGLSSHFIEDGDQLAAGIDGYCQHATGARSISWQYCVGAIVWFIRNP